MDDRYVYLVIGVEDDIDDDEEPASISEARKPQMPEQGIQPFSSEDLALQRDYTKPQASPAPELEDEPLPSRKPQELEQDPECRVLSTGTEQARKRPAQAVDVDAEPRKKRRLVQSLGVSELEQRVRRAVYEKEDEMLQRLREETQASLEEERQARLELQKLLLEEANARLKLEDKVREMSLLEDKVREMETQLLFVDGELIFVVDVLENLHSKLSYALQKAMAERLRGAGDDEKLWYFRSFPGQTLLSITYCFAVDQLLKLRGKSRKKYIAELQREAGAGDRGDEITGCFQDEIRAAEQSVANELEVGVQALKVTVAVHLFELKRGRNAEAHKHQLHPPVYWRAEYNGADPAPGTSIDTALKLPPLSTPVSPSVQDHVHEMRVLEIAWSRLEKTLGKNRFKRMNAAVVNSIFVAVQAQLASAIATSCSSSLRLTGNLPDELPMLECVRQQDWPGWGIWLRENPSFMVYLSDELEWFSQDYANTWPFFGWPGV